MGEIKVPYYSVRKGGRGFWLSTKSMQAKGFPSSIPCGPDGPDAWKIAQEWNARWQAARTGREPAPKYVWPKGSLGEAFDRFRRTETWKTDKAHRTREDWERGWKHISPIFGDLAPSTVTLEHIDAWYHTLKANTSVAEAHRAMKIWRALWQVAGALRYCVADQDPSFGIRRETPKGRSATWEEGEVVRLVKKAWRRGYSGLACIIAIAYDAQFAPVDARSLRLADSRDDGTKLWFETTGRRQGVTPWQRSPSALRRWCGHMSRHARLRCPKRHRFSSRAGAPPTQKTASPRISGTSASSCSRETCGSCRTCAEPERSRRSQAGPILPSSRRRWRTRSHRRRIFRRPICRSTRLRSSWRTRRGSGGAGASGSKKQGKKLKLSAPES